MASSKPESKLIKAAGAVAWRPGPDGRPEILLVHRRKYNDWSLPKGKVDPGEVLPVTAVREVLEEGGARLALGRRLASVRYNVGGRPKRVHYWSAAVASVDDRAVPNDEVDQIEWVAADRAADRISYNRDNAVVADFARLPAQTVPVILLRHAKAVAKSHWKRADDRRPLDDSGRADAKALAELLACFGARARLITSPAVRCVETLRPFAELSGAELRVEPSLYIHNPSRGTDPADSPPSIAALVAEAVKAGEPTIFCAHRENIPDLQAAALAALGLNQPASDAAPGSALADAGRKAFPELPKEWDDALPTSGFWVLNLTLPALSPAVQPASASSAAPAPAPAAPSAQAPFWRRWFRSRGGARTRSPHAPATPPISAATSPMTAAVPQEFLAAPVLAAEPTETQPAAPEGVATQVPPVTAETSGAPAPAPRLISADRYDLSEP
jgi:8-oxo-dGTP pyrophosphatase MutT (NUDIX family)/phosphohistidine phosphatase SixA